MRFIRIAAAVGIVVASAALGTGPAGAQTGGEDITNYTVAMHLQADGTLSIDERISYYFGSTPHHGIFRDIVESETYDTHHERTYDIGPVTVTADNRSTLVGVSHSAHYLHLQIGDPNVTITGVHTYHLQYTVGGAATTFADHQELNWDAIGNQWPVPIDRAAVTVTTPAAITRIACYGGQPGSHLACTASSKHGKTATFSQTGLGGYEGLTVVVGIPPGTIVPDPQPHLVREHTLADAFAVRVNTLVPAIAVAILAIGGVLWLAWRRGRDRRYAGSAVDAAFGNDSGTEERVGLGRGDEGPVEFVPPDGVLPGQVGTLVDEHANLVDVTATIVDLAVRGWLTITDLTDDYELTATQVVGKGTLLPYETDLMNALFKNPLLGEGASVKLSDLKYKFRAELAGVQSLMYDDVVTQGWYRVRPDRTRQRWLAIALVLLVVCVLATVVVGASSSFALIPAGLVLGAVTLIVVAGHMPARTGKGRAMFSRVRGFRRLFDEGDQGLREKFAEEHDIFSKYLPYAIVFGCTDKWARVFAQLDASEIDTSWYHGNAPFNAILLASSINHFGTLATGTLYASMPSSSSSSGFGGGFSGGGGGGGGGGSW